MRKRAPKSWSGDASAQVVFLADEDAVDLGRVRDTTALLSSIAACLPADCVVYLEGGSLAGDVREFVERSATEPTAHVARGTTWPKPRVFHVPATPKAMAELVRLSAHHAAPELCDHLVIYRGDEVLLTAYDFGTDQVQVSRSLGPEVIEELRSRLAPLS